MENDEKKLQLTEDTLVYVDRSRSKLIIEIDLPETKQMPGPGAPDQGKLLVNPLAS
ncbi:MAG: hypothetical protein HZA49_00515 [Planctomycetes bacterium]|nr:hypothetical protein [Planctomycetota bacterium]